MLLQLWQEQSRQNTPAAKQSQYNFKHFDFLQLHFLDAPSKSMPSSSLLWSNLSANVNFVFDPGVCKSRVFFTLLPPSLFDFPTGGVMCSSLLLVRLSRLLDFFVEAIGVAPAFLFSVPTGWSLGESAALPRIVFENPLFHSREAPVVD